MFSFKKSHIVTQMVTDYMASCDQVMETLHQAFSLFLQQGLSPAFSDLVHTVDCLESECDDKRRTIESAMYEKALIPESRTDILGLMDRLDRIPNRAEHIAYDVLNEHLLVPDPFAEHYRQLIGLNHDCYRYTAEAVRALFTDMDAIRGLVERIDRKEGESDVLRRSIIQSVFGDDGVAPDQRILLRDLARHISGLSDRCEDVGDILTMMAVRRMI